MTSDRTPEPDPRRKRALYIGGAIALAAVAWNFDGWRDDPVEVTVIGDSEDIREARDAIREAVRDEIRDEVRGGFRGDRDGDAAAEDADNAEIADASEEETTVDAETASEEVVAETRDGNQRVVETASGENQRSFRIEGDDGRGVTISVDTGSEE
ncbi:MAG: hypothetical protein ACTS1Z_08565 [Parasphingopyxis sp.]|uniref:hypothetical protein n=1 Tax=Parasphingopyxis sp. TaxID=1920299 RepID=UPI003FA0B7FE